MGSRGAKSRNDVGLAIPYFSRPDYLRESLASLVEQTDPDWTAVVIDDCSPERGAEEAVAALDDPRIRYVRNAFNLGLAGNFNRCLVEPGTDIVAIFHADDLLEPNYVATIRSAHRAAPCAALVAPMARAIGADGQEIDTAVDKVKRCFWPRGERFELCGDSGLARLMHAFFVYCPAISYRVALLPEARRARAFDTRWKQVMDLDLFAHVLLDGGTIVLDRTCVYRYRRHDATVTAQNARAFTRLAEETRLAYEVADQAKIQGWPRTARAARLHWTQRVNGAVALAATLRTGSTASRRSAVRDIVSRH